MDALATYPIQAPQEGVQPSLPLVFRMGRQIKSLSKIAPHSFQNEEEKDDVKDNVDSESGSG